VFHLEIGEIISQTGDQMVVKANVSDPKFMNKKVYKDNQELGRIVDIIGRVENPHFIIKKNKNAEMNIGETISVK